MATGMKYSTHIEWKDGTFSDDPTGTYTNKREANRVARLAAAATPDHSDIARILVCALPSMTTVAAFEAGR